MVGDDAPCVMPVHTSLLTDNICFISGMEMEGIYRLSGQHSKITQLLKLLLEGIVFIDHFITLTVCGEVCFS